MDKKSKVFFLVFLLLIIGSVAMTYWRIMVKRDYIISAQVDCDPALETCFVYECDPEDPADPECATLSKEEHVTYYKLINKNAKKIPLCDSAAGECPELTCEEGEEECEITLCDDTNVPEGESCNDPKQYVLDNPPKEGCGCGEAEEEPGDVAEAEEAQKQETEKASAANSKEEESACGCTAESSAEEPTEEESEQENN